MKQGNIFHVGMKDHANKRCDHEFTHNCKQSTDSSVSLCNTCAKNVAAGKPCT